MRASTCILAVVGAVTALVCAPSPAEAYPQWQFSSGTSRCTQCHFSPAGGGLINNYGRDAAGEELSTWQGDGGFLHGAADLPTWLALGFDGRLAVVSHENGNPNGPLRALFPMQADAHLRVVVSGAFSLQATGGLRGQARAANEPLGPDNPRPISASRAISREHFVMWRPAVLGPYVRAGRFYAPYGLRLSEHTAYVRRDLGFNLLEESYGLSGGVVKRGWELHLTAFGPDFVREMGSREQGAAGMFEARLADAHAIGLHGRIGLTENANRFAGGAFGKTYVDAIRTLFMAQADVVHWRLSGGLPGRNQLVGYVGATVFPLRGVWLSAYGELNQTDVQVKKSVTQAGTGQLNWFPYPHFEVVLVGRIQAPDGQDAAKTGLFLLHYYL